MQGDSLLHPPIGPMGLRRELYRADGSLIKDLRRDGPLFPREADVIFKGDSLHNAWTSSIVTDSGRRVYIAYSVSRRVREIGIRIALGADYLGVVKLVVRRGMALAGIGIVLGALGAAVLSSLLRSVLYGISGLDPLSFVAASLTLLAVAFLANFFPARRAAQVDPLIALRSD